MAEENLIQALEEAGLQVATAESLTGGLLAASLTEIAGSSKVFLGGVVAYQNQVKQQLLGVSSQLMQQQGAVDAEVVAQMAIGIRERFAKANEVELDRVIGLATTGVAGPGPSEGKPAGTVFVGISSRISDAVYAHSFEGDRDAVRKQSVQAALEALREQLQLSGGL